MGIHLVHEIGLDVDRECFPGAGSLDPARVLRRLHTSVDGFVIDERVAGIRRRLPLH
ncbi:hypothetical protein [Embleya scabrispora]|uniref:hypothetical protein n=1 Tax=Embleya scabrispora TaxID=159449 RepID=UPI000368C8F2|nr:hypothetical protein [Embleya scabrispora]MYS82013.1 hypothetical protein [Streptomyces sp. SID5474]